MSYSPYVESEVPEDLYECAVGLMNTIQALTTEGGNALFYINARAQLMENEATRKLLPDFVRTSGETGSLIVALKRVSSGSGSWKTRREYVETSFKPLLNFLESGGSAADAIITGGLSSYDAPAIQECWKKALERRFIDPEGAVTAASTLLEDVCKHIIEDSGRHWEHSWKVPKLYREVSEVLNLAPSQHQEEVFKTILGNCQSVVQSIASLRNKGGDAHAGGRTRVPFKARHAALTVNLAGSMALFLIETWSARLEQN